MAEITMMELLKKVANTVKDYWEKERSEEDNSFKLKDDKKILYGDKFVELMKKATFGDEMISRHTDKDIALRIGISAPTFSKIKTMSTNLQPENLKKILDAILGCIYREEKRLDDEMKDRASELLFLIFRRKEIRKIVEHFKFPIANSLDNLDNITELRAMRIESHSDLVEKIFGNPELIEKPISYKKYFIDGKIEKEELKDNEYGDIRCYDYKAKDDSKIHIVIFDTHWIEKKYLHQRIRCLKRKNNVFAVLMVEKGEYHDDEDFYRNECSNIMAIEYKEAREENFEFCFYEYLRGICLSWYDEKCKRFMTEVLNKIFISHK